MIILSFESKNKAREYFYFILSNASIKLETIVLNDFAYQYDYEICIDLLYSKSGDFLYNYEIFRVYVRIEDKKVLIFAEDELDFQWSEKHISDYFLALYCKHKLNIKVKREEVTLYG